MILRLLLLFAGVAAAFSSQVQHNRELLGFPPRDSTTACKLKRTDELPARATEAHWFWIGLAVPTLRIGEPIGQVIATGPPPRRIWVSYDQTGHPVLLADTVHDQMGLRVAQVQFGPGREVSGFTQREDIDTALVRRLMNESSKRSLMEAVDSVARALKQGPRSMLDSVALQRAREIGEYLWSRRCTSGVRT